MIDAAPQFLLGIHGLYVATRLHGDSEFGRALFELCKFLVHQVDTQMHSFLRDHSLFLPGCTLDYCTFVQIPSIVANCVESEMRQSFPQVIFNEFDRMLFNLKDESATVQADLLRVCSTAFS
jgi:hypothetical protein